MTRDKRVVRAALEVRDAEVSYHSLRVKLAQARERKKRAMKDLLSAFVKQVVGEEIERMVRR